MKSVDIFDKNWLDLVFEGKNQAYGAYHLRRQSPTTTLFAFFIGVLLVAAISGITLFSRSSSAGFGIPAADDIFAIPVVLHNIELPKPKPPQMPATAAVPLTRNEEDPVQLNNPVVTQTIEAQQNIATNQNNEPAAPIVDGGSSEGTAAATTATSGGESNAGDTGESNTPTNLAILDKKPEFPGGMQKFYTYISKNFEKPEDVRENTVRVFVSFVIEKDGSMTDIVVARDPGNGLGKEAIRVLKSLKTKWKPGIYKGQPVRTAYSLPITVVTN